MPALSRLRPHAAKMKKSIQNEGLPVCSTDQLSINDDIYQRHVFLCLQITGRSQLCVCAVVRSLFPRDAPWRWRSGSTLVEVGEALVLLADGRRGGGTQDVGEGAPGGAVFGQQPGLLALQEGRQGLPEGEEEGMNARSLSLTHALDSFI